MGKSFLAALASPSIIIQLAIYIYMTVFGMRAVFQIFSNQYIEWTYALGMLYNLGLTMVALLRCVSTEPGYVTTALVEKLKNQLLVPR